MFGRILAAVAVTVAALAAPANAAVIQERGGLTSGTNGIATGPDGNLWVAEEFSSSVARMTPSGTILAHYPVGSGPISIANGPGDRVWVTVPGANKLVWFDATSPAPSPHDVSTGAGCGPVAIVAGGDGRMYFSLPTVGACGGSRLGTVASNGTGLFLAAHPGTVYDLAAANGKLFAPDFDTDVVRRVTLGTLGTEAAISVPAGSGPDGIAADGANNLWVTLHNTGRIARFPSAQGNGTFAAVIVPTGGALVDPFGIVAAADGRIYVTGQGSANVLRISADGTTFRFYSTPGGGEPFQIVDGPDHDLFFTDRNSSRILRYLSTAPLTTTGAASAVGATAASVTAGVNPRGNDTQVVFDYGTTTGYGSTSAPVIVPAGDGVVAVNAVLSGLTPGTAYHVRARGINEEGSTPGADTTVTTTPGVVDGDRDGVSPPLDCNDANAAIRPGAVDKPGDKIDQDCSGKDAPFPLLAARVTFGWAFFGARTALTKVAIAGLRGGESVRVTCKGSGCSFKTKTYKNVKKGKRSLASLFGRKRRLRTGAKVEVRIIASDTVGSSAVLTVGKRKKDPRIARACVKPGASKTSRCG